MSGCKTQKLRDSLSYLMPVHNYGLSVGEPRRHVYRITIQYIKYTLTARYLVTMLLVSGKALRPLHLLAGFDRVFLSHLKSLS